MAKVCSICSATQEAQNKIIEWHQNGQSYREIESSLADEFKLNISNSSIRLNISNSSIRRHLLNCIGAEKDVKKKHTLLFKEIMNHPQPDGADMHKALCHILLEGVEMFSQRMKETNRLRHPY
jgi:hypothetical protein